MREFIVAAIGTALMLAVPILMDKNPEPINWFQDDITVNNGTSNRTVLDGERWQCARQLHCQHRPGTGCSGDLGNKKMEAAR